MAGVLNQREPPPSSKELTMTPAPYLYFQAQTPVWKLSPKNNGSTLYDSYELRAVSQQLNRTIEKSKSSCSPRTNHIKFTYPFRGCLDRVYKENAKTPKRVIGRKVVSSTTENKSKSTTKRNSVPRLWMKFKRVFLSKKASTYICGRPQT